MNSSSLFRLNQFEEFELWMNALVAHHKRAGKPLGEEKPISANRDFRNDVRTSLSVVKELRALSHRIADALELREAHTPFRARVSRDRKRQMRDSRRHAQSIDEFFDFVNFLAQYRALALSQARRPPVTPAEFKALSSIMIREVGRLRKNEAYIQLKKKLEGQKFLQLVRRDVLSSLDSDGAREHLERVLIGFFRILATIEYIQHQMRRSFKYRKFMTLFRYCQLSHRKLVKLLENSRKYLESSHREISTALHSTASALRMEARKVFARELRDLDSHKKIEVIYAHMENACGLLQYAVQNSLINLIHLLNPNFSEFEVFENLSQRYKESVILLNDLRRLYQLVRDAAAHGEQDKFSEIRETLQLFRITSMKFLMFKDWHSCEQFIEEYQSSEQKSRPLMLHRFEVFLSTLIGEVQKRSVFDRFGRDVAQFPKGQ